MVDVEPIDLRNEKGQFMPGTQIWTARSKHGRDKIFASPEIMREAGFAYFQWCVDNPHPEEIWDSKRGEKIIMYKMRVFTAIGLCHFLHVTESYFRHFRSEAKKVQSDENSYFITTIEEFDEIIFRQKFEGAASNLINPSFIGKDLNMVDRSGITIFDRELTEEERETRIAALQAKMNQSKDVD